MESLFPDIIFSLLGYKSQVLHHIADNDSDLEFMAFRTEHQVILKRFLSVADEFKKLNDFILDNPRPESNGREPVNRHGVYMEAFVEGILIAMCPYKDGILHIERDWIRQRENYTMLDDALRIIEAFKPLIISIQNLVEQVEFSHLHGGQILNLLYETILMKFMDDKALLSLIFQQCLQVLISQLNTFFSRGVIYDPHKEFFIEAVFSKSTKEFKQFSLVHNLMPSFIPVSTASKMTRIGEVVKSLQLSHEQSSLKNYKDIKEYKDISIELYGEKKIQLFSELQSLGNVTLFTKHDFVKAIDKFYIVVDEYMFKASLNNNSIKYHMKLVRDFYLLGNGEFFMHFLNKMYSLSLKSVHNLRAIKVAFINTAQDVKIPKSMYQVFGFGSLENKTSEEVTWLTWSTIKVTIETTWPLQFIFTKHVQKNYSKLFSFLSRIKRVQLNLHQTWIEKKTKSYKVNDHDDQLRTKLTFLIDTLYSYLQLDVIEDEYFTFLEKLSNANDFQTIKHIHDVFQTNIMRDSFLFVEEVHMTFNRILDLCENYCKYMTDITAALNPKFYKHCNDELSLLFTNKSNKLVTLLNIIKEIHVTPKPNQFLVRLNYNDWFSEFILEGN